MRPGYERRNPPCRQLKKGAQRRAGQLRAPVQVEQAHGGEARHDQQPYLVGPTHIRRRRTAKGVCKKQGEVLQSPVGLVFKGLHAEIGVNIK
jgi:hypothetical protein